jgi:pyruvate carboxylase subunit B
VKYVVDVGTELIDVTIDGGAVRVDGEELSASLSELPGTPIALLTLGDAVHRVVVARGDARGRYALSIDGRRYDVEALDERTRAIRELSKASAAASGPAPLVAPMPGLIVRVHVEVGATVQAGQGLVVMEAMKMENELRAVAGGVVKAIRVSPGMAVERGSTLVELE